MRLLFLILIFPLLVFSQVEDIERDIENVAKELSTPLIKKSFIADFLNNQSKNLIEHYLKENPFSKMTQAELRALVDSILKDQKVAQILKKNPKAYDFLIAWLHDKEAMKSFLSIVNRPKKVKIYGYTILIVFILSFILNLLNSNKNLFKRIIFKILILLTASCINTLAFAFIFRKELAPTFKLLKEVIF